MYWGISLPPGRDRWIPALYLFDERCGSDSTAPRQPLRALNRLAVRRERDLDVAARRVRVGTHLMRAAHQLDGEVSILDRRKAHVELNAELKAAGAGRGERPLRVDRRVGRLDLRAPGDDAERSLEAGGVADGEQLLGVGAIAGAAHLGGKA